jgi:hypothetical protein
VGDSEFSPEGLVGDEDGIVTEIKVSTRRDLMTFSSPFCELSGSTAEKDTQPAAEEGAVNEGNCVLK